MQFDPIPRLKFPEYQQLEKLDRDTEYEIILFVTGIEDTYGRITINENADGDVVRDMLNGFERAFPTQHKDYRHFEGNSHAHMKSTIFGPSQTLIVSQGNIILGVWQSVYLCEFDGPRNRTYYVKIIED